MRNLISWSRVAPKNEFLNAAREVYLLNWLGRVFLLMAYLAILGTSTPAIAQTLDEYKAAVEAASRDEGCASIPKSDLRDRCNRAADFVKQDCKEKPFRCKDLLENRKLAENIKGKEDSISSLKKDKEELERKKSSASDSDKREIEDKIKQLENKIDSDSRSLEEMKRSLSTDRSDAGIRADQGRRCLEARKDVQYLFDSARSSAQSENDSEKKPFANKLIEYWERKTKEHDEAFKLTKEAIEYCEECKSGDI